MAGCMNLLSSILMKDAEKIVFVIYIHIYVQGAISLEECSHRGRFLPTGTTDEKSTTAPVDKNWVCFADVSSKNIVFKRRFRNHHRSGHVSTKRAQTFFTRRILSVIRATSRRVNTYIHTVVLITSMHT